MASSPRSGNLFLYVSGCVSLALLALITWIVRGPQPFIDSEARRAYQASLHASNNQFDPGSSLVAVDGTLWIRRTPSRECNYYCGTATKKADGTFAVELPVGFMPHADKSVPQSQLQKVTSLTYWDPVEHEKAALHHDDTVRLPDSLQRYGSVGDLGWEVRFAPASFVRVTPGGKAFLFDHSLRYEKLDDWYGYAGPDASVIKALTGDVFVELPEEYEPLVWHAPLPEDTVVVTLVR